MNHLQDFYLQFWSKIFGITPFDLKNPEPAFLSSGFYIERHGDKYIFFYLDLYSGKKILASSENNLVDLRKFFDLRALERQDPDSIRNESFFKERPLAFQDIDFGFLNLQDFTPVPSVDFDIRALSEHQTEEIEEFYLNCSEDDKDTLDLTFENETALGLYIENKLAGIARFTPLRDTQIADITVLVCYKARGKRYSAPLVSSLVEKILKSNLAPKYRVKEDNNASIAIAKKLGFKPMYHLLAWEQTSEE